MFRKKDYDLKLYLVAFTSNFGIYFSNYEKNQCYPIERMININILRGVENL